MYLIIDIQTPLSSPCSDRRRWCEEWRWPSASPLVQICNESTDHDWVCSSLVQIWFLLATPPSWWWLSVSSGHALTLLVVGVLVRRQSLGFALVVLCVLVVFVSPVPEC
ncbi:hypothetical protein QL285_018884 [Trifolium repens]|nr:hypothetical protein QL285_018884 [Trifolium repens]